MTSGRILVVDDEVSLRLTLAANLELADFEVLEAACAEEAIEILEREEVDLVLSDIRMPGMHGVDLFRRVKAIRPGTPVILMSAFAVEHLIEQAIVEGVFTVLTKPFDVDRVVQVLLRAIEHPIVLVLDEETAERVAVVSALQRVGVSAAEAADLDEAADLVEGEVVDVCVVDLQTAGGDLETVVRRLAMRERRIAVIAVATPPAKDLLARAAQQVSCDCMLKPIPTRGLLAAIGRARLAVPP
jgi:DNA-binding NtrC family response regulator